MNPDGKRRSRVTASGHTRSPRGRPPIGLRSYHFHNLDTPEYAASQLPKGRGAPPGPWSRGHGPDTAGLPPPAPCESALTATVFLTLPSSPILTKAAKGKSSHGEPPKRPLKFPWRARQRSKRGPVSPVKLATCQRAKAPSSSKSASPPTHCNRIDACSPTPGPRAVAPHSRGAPAVAVPTPPSRSILSGGACQKRKRAWWNSNLNRLAVAVAVAVVLHRIQCICTTVYTPGPPDTPDLFCSRADTYTLDYL